MSAMIELDIPNLVNELRGRVGLTREECENLGATFSSVNHWENGKRTLKSCRVWRLYEVKENLEKDNHPPMFRGSYS